MPVAPSTTFQLVALLAFFMPGLVYEAVRAQQRGPSPALRDSTTRLLSALLMSTLLNTIYMVCAGPFVSSLVARFPTGDAWVWAQAAGWTLALLFMVPATAAGAVNARQVNRNASGGAQPPHDKDRLRVFKRRYDPTPSAWDYLFIRAATNDRFLLITLKDGSAVAGLFAEDSFVSGFPDPHEIYLQEAWRVDENGVIREPLNRGVWVPGEHIATLEVIRPEPQEDAA